MVDQLCSVLHISTESHAFSPVFALAVLLLCAGQKEGVAAQLAYLGVPPAALPTQQGFSTKQGTLASNTLLAKRL